MLFSTIFYTCLLIFINTAHSSPQEGFQNIAICGTYKLEESDKGGRAEHQTRHGRLLVIDVSTTADDGACDIASNIANTASSSNDSVSPTTTNKAQPHASVISTLDVPGVFDIKWLTVLGDVSDDNSDNDCDGDERSNSTVPVDVDTTQPQLPRCVLGHAAADGMLYAYSLTMSTGKDDITPETTLERFAEVDCRADDAPDGTLALSLAWNNRNPVDAAVSLSDGNITISRLLPSGGFYKECEWHAHDLEAWICAYDTYSPRTLYTGADDAKFKIWDLRQPSEVGPIRINSKVYYITLYHIIS